MLSNKHKHVLDDGYKACVFSSLIICMLQLPGSDI